MGRLYQIPTPSSRNSVEEKAERPQKPKTARKQGLVDPAGPTTAGLQQQQQGQPGSAPDGISADRSGRKPPLLPQKLSPPDNYLQMKN